MEGSAIDKLAAERHFIASPCRLVYDIVHKAIHFGRGDRRSVRAMSASAQKKSLM